MVVPRSKYLAVFDSEGCLACYHVYYISYDILGANILDIYIYIYIPSILYSICIINFIVMSITAIVIVMSVIAIVIISSSSNIVVMLCFESRISSV